MGKMTEEERKAKYREYCARWRKKNKEHEKERGKKYRKENPEKIKALAVKWAKENPGKKKENYNLWRKNNPEKAKIRNNKWKKVNPEKEKRRTAKWKAAHPEREAIYSSNRRARKMSGEGKLSPDLALRLLAFQKNRCALCRKSLKKTGYHLDHIIPLARGGKNEDANMQATCPKCNLGKSHKDPMRYMRSQGFLL
jgi:5-methylcytosine-specific restriction endonuclease McrA